MGIWRTISDAVSEDLGDLPDLACAIRVCFRLLLAALLGGLLGWDRERLGKAAGLRTHMLIAVGSAVFVLVAQQAGMQHNDMSRVIQGLVTGLGFLGGGAILKLTAERRVEGLTTAAGIWLTAGIGITAGLGRGATAVVITILAFLILAVLRPIERWIEGER